jgi:hypothetical protein
MFGAELSEQFLNTGKILNNRPIFKISLKCLSAYLTSSSSSSSSSSLLLLLTAIGFPPGGSVQYTSTKNTNTI